MWCLGLGINIKYENMPNSRDKVMFHYPFMGNIHGNFSMSTFPPHRTTPIFRTFGHFSRISFERKMAAAAEAPAEASITCRRWITFYNYNIIWETGWFWTKSFIALTKLPDFRLVIGSNLAIKLGAWIEHRYYNNSFPPRPFKKNWTNHEMNLLKL